MFNNNNNAGGGQQPNNNIFGNNNNQNNNQGGGNNNIFGNNNNNNNNQQQPQNNNNIFGNNNMMQNNNNNNNNNNNMFGNQQQQQQPQQQNMQVFNNMVPNQQNTMGQQQQPQQQQGGMFGGGMFGQQQQQQQVNNQDMQKNYENHSLSYCGLATDGLHTAIKQIFNKKKYSPSRNEFEMSVQGKFTSYYLLSGNNPFNGKTLSYIMKEAEKAKKNQPQQNQAFGNMNNNTNTINDSAYILQMMEEVQNVINRNKKKDNSKKTNQEKEQSQLVVSNTIKHLNLKGQSTQSNQYGGQMQPNYSNFFAQQLNQSFYKELQTRCNNLLQGNDVDISISGLKLNQQNNQSKKQKILENCLVGLSEFKNQSIFQQGLLSQILLQFRNIEFNKAMQKESYHTYQKYSHSTNQVRQIPNHFVKQILKYIYHPEICILEQRIGELLIMTNEKLEMEEEDQEIEDSQQDMIYSLQSLLEYLILLSGNSMDIHKKVDQLLQINGKIKVMVGNSEFAKHKQKTQITNQELFRLFKETDEKLNQIIRKQYEYVVRTDYTNTSRLFN